MLENLSKIATIASAFIGGIILAVLTYILQAESQAVSLRSTCMGMVDTLTKRFENKPIQIAEVDARVRLLPEQCKIDRVWIVDLIRAVANVQENTQDISSQVPAGWVAVGFMNSAANSDVNFVKPDRKSLAATVPNGSIVRAKWQVNVRPEPADWRSVKGVLNIGQCFIIEDQRVLPAQDREQLWAKGRQIACPST